MYPIHLLEALKNTLIAMMQSATGTRDERRDCVYEYMSDNDAADAFGQFFDTCTPEDEL